MIPRALPLLAAALLVAPASAADLALESSPTHGRLTLHVTDPANSTWSLQTSTDLVSWSDRQTLRVHNTEHTHTIDNSVGLGRIFFRLTPAPATTLPHSVSDATILPVILDNYALLNLPAHLASPVIAGQDNTPAANPATDAGATLGRVLFYDKRLSANHTVACASCHQPEHGFSDPRPLSIGFDGGRTDRNSMGLTSARYYLRRSFFWDERAATLEDQVLMPIQNEVEMGLTLDEMTTRVAAEPYYAELFTAAFGSPNVTSGRVSRALAQFVRSIVSSKTKYDEGVASGFANFTTQENLGRQIFLGQVGNATCATCHGSDNFVPGNAVFNNGIETPSIDRGVGAITGNPADDGKFKVPSLRNIALTAPYMHDGRFATLEQVVEFYANGVTDHPNLAPQLRNPPGTPGAGLPRRLNLTTAQKAALVAFLHTLTDTTVTTDPRFSDPFRSTGELTLP